MSSRLLCTFSWCESKRSCSSACTPSASPSAPRSSRSSDSKRSLWGCSWISLDSCCSLISPLSLEIWWAFLIYSSSSIIYTKIVTFFIFQSIQLALFETLAHGVLTSAFTDLSIHHWHFTTLVRRQSINFKEINFIQTLSNFSSFSTLRLSFLIEWPNELKVQKILGKTMGVYFA